MARPLLAALVLAAPNMAAAQGAIMVPVTVDGQSVRIEMRIYKPPGRGRFPTLVFNHGSTGRGDNPSLFTRSFDAPALASFFAERGWAVVMPSRRGRGGSEGQYDEGFNAMRTAYTCDTGPSLTGAERALRDLAAAMQAILAMDFVDPARVVIGGQSRGGVLSVAYAGMHPGQIRGVLNFVGGWMGAGCRSAATINQTLFKKGAGFHGETLWLYGDNDPFYPLSHSRENFEAFITSGGKGTFHDFPAPAGFNGHQIYLRPATWSAQMEAYLAALKLQPPASKRDRPAKKP